MSYNFTDEGIPNHKDYLELSKRAPYSMSLADFNIAYYVYKEKDYTDDLYNSFEHSFEVSGDTVTIDDIYEFDCFDIDSNNSSMGDFDVYWFGNSLMFYKGETYIFLLNPTDSLKFLSYGSNKVSTYQLLQEHTNVKDHLGHVFINGCVAFSYMGPWTPCFEYRDGAYTAIVAHNNIISAEHGEVDYNDRYEV